MARVNLEVPQETKQEWQEAAESDPNAGGNLSGFIRSAVSAKLSGASGSSENEDLREEIAELKNMMNNLYDSIETTNTRLRTIEEQITTDPETERLANELFSQLPTKERFNEWHSGQGEDRKLGKRPEDLQTAAKAQQGGDPKAFAEFLDCSEIEIQEAISYLTEHTPLIQETEIDGETRIYRER